MHAAIRSYRVMDVDAFVKRVEDEFAEQVQPLDGFVGYYVVDGDDGTATTITVGESEQAVQASTELADQWVVERASHLVEGAPHVTAGRVRVRAEANRSPTP